MRGVVHQISVSAGGVPKLPAPGPVAMTPTGVEGDDQSDTKHHGGPEQHVCIYSLEVIEALRAEGHPIFPGAAGENLTVSGLDWELLERGQRMTIGADAVVEVTWPATPCGKNSQWFADRDPTRMSYELRPGWSRWYAKVITPGTISAGDAVEISTGSIVDGDVATH